MELHFEPQMRPIIYSGGGWMLYNAPTLGTVPVTGNYRFDEPISWTKAAQILAHDSIEHPLVDGKVCFTRYMAEVFAISRARLRFDPYAAINKALSSPTLANDQGAQSELMKWADEWPYSELNGSSVPSSEQEVELPSNCPEFFCEDANPEIVKMASVYLQSHHLSFNSEDQLEQWARNVVAVMDWAISHESHLHFGDVQDSIEYALELAHEAGYRGTLRPIDLVDGVAQDWATDWLCKGEPLTISEI